MKKSVDKKWDLIYNVSCRCKRKENTNCSTEYTGVWLSLARALDLGSRGRRFESCHPDL